MPDVGKTVITPIVAARILKCSPYEIRAGLEHGYYGFGKCIVRDHNRTKTKEYIIYAEKFCEYVKQNAEKIAFKERKMLKAVMRLT